MVDDPQEEILEETLTGESPREDFPCDTCGADLRWDPDDDALACDHCGARVAVPRAEGTVLERPLAAAADAARGLGLALRVLQCGTCGARLTLEGADTSTSCAWCGSSQVLAQEANRNALRPESLVPMDVGEDAVHEGFRRWVAGLWFRPNGLKKAAAVEAVGIYAPFWTFDARVHSDWSADAGYHYWVTQTYTTRVNGKRVTRTRRVRKTRWRPAWGERDDVFDDLLVGASAGLPADLVEALGDFDTSALVPYRPEYLAGWRAEEYRLDLEGAWEQGRERIERVQRERCAGDVPGDTYRGLRVHNRISDVRWKHCLLPVWSLVYRHGGKPYRVLVHGQTGRVVGRAPWSWVKILVAVLVASFAIATVFAYLRR